MRQLEYAHWYYTDDLITEMADFGLKAVSASEFFSAMLHQLQQFGINPYFSPDKYTHEWQYWQKYCRVGSVAVVRLNPQNDGWETLMVKNKNKWFSELSTTWPGGKAELEDVSFWHLAARELKEEVNLDVFADRSRVVAVIEVSRVVTAVLPLPFDDPRFNDLKLQEAEVDSFIWVPLSLSLPTVKEPAKETRPSDNGTTLPKEDPKDLRMPWEAKEHFKKLQQIHAETKFETKQDNVEEILSRDPRSWNAHSTSAPQSPAQ